MGKKHITIIGAGIMGLLAAVELCQKDVVVEIYTNEIRNFQGPVASLTNQTLLHSGMYFFRKYRHLPSLYQGDKLSLPAILNFSAGYFLNSVGKPHQKQGIYKVEPKAAQNLEKLRNSIAGKGFLNPIKILDYDVLSPELAQSDIYDFFSPESGYVLVPDQPFRFATYMDGLIEFLEEQSIFIKYNSRAVLEPSQKGFNLYINGMQKHTDTVILCTGARTPQLVQPLSHHWGLQHDMRIYKTPILITDDNRRLNANVFIDFEKKFSIVRQSRLTESSVSRNFLIYSSAVSYPCDLITLQPTEYPIITPLQSLVRNAEITDFYNNNNDNYCYRIERKDHYPEVSCVPGYKNLIIAIPGKATMAPYTCQQILVNLEKLWGVKLGGLNNPSIQHSRIPSRLDLIQRL